MTKLEKLVEHLESGISSAKKDLERFKGSLEKDPAYALEWATGAFEMAAKLEIYSSALAAIQNGCNVELLMTHLSDEAMRRASNRSNSSSSCANLMEDCRRAAVAQLCRDLQFVL